MLVNWLFRPPAAETELWRNFEEPKLSFKDICILFWCFSHSTVHSSPSSFFPVSLVEIYMRNHSVALYCLFFFFLHSFQVLFIVSFMAHSCEIKPRIKQFLSSVSSLQCFHLIPVTASLKKRKKMAVKIRSELSYITNYAVNDHWFIILTKIFFLVLRVDYNTQQFTYIK